MNLFVTGVDVTSTGSISIPGTSEITATVTPTGTLGDLLPILTIPGMEAQNFTNLAASRLHPGTDLAERHQRDQHGHGHVHHGGRVSEVQPFPLNPKLSLTGTFGLPVALALDALGAPVDALSASGSGATAFVDAVETGNWSGGSRRAPRCPGRRHQRIPQRRNDAAPDIRCRGHSPYSQRSVKWNSRSANPVHRIGGLGFVGNAYRSRRRHAPQRPRYRPVQRVRAARDGDRLAFVGGLVVERAGVAPGHLHEPGLPGSRRAQCLAYRKSDPRRR